MPKTRTKAGTGHEADIRAGIFQSVLDFAADMIWVKNLDGKILEVNAAMVRQLGLPREEIVGRPIYDFYSHPGGIERLKAWEERVKKQSSGFHLATLRTKKGTTLEVELRGSMMETAQGRLILVIARVIADDMKELRRAKTLYEGFRRSNDVMFYADVNGVILDVNDAFVRHYGWSREEAVGKTPAILRSRHSTDEFYKRMWSSILDPERGYWRGEVINKTKDGREVPLILTITSVKDEGGRIVGYVSNAVDLTEQHALQDRVAHAESLAALGEMAAVVAHEIRNPLGSIVMAANQLAAGDLETEDRQMVLKVLRSESQRLNESLSNFLSYARPRPVKLEPRDCNALVEEVATIVKANSQLVREVKVRLKLNKSLKSCTLDPDQIRQVIWNIVLNALQALDGRGTMTLETGLSNGFAFLRVADTGPGIPSDSLKSIFKPFHTTKQQGTGLGLAVAERIVKAHGGRIEVDSTPGHGATFTILIPSAEA